MKQLSSYEKRIQELESKIKEMKEKGLENTTKCRGYKESLKSLIYSTV